MDQAKFTQQLVTDGFEEIVTVERPANGALPAHSHPFEAKALILQGSLTLHVAAVAQTYSVGDIFHLAPGQLHEESYGPEGVTYLVGRKTSGV